ncbi:MAG: hypothetical protein WEC12_01420, partial [Balneolaceae bacterium]
NVGNEGYSIRGGDFDEYRIYDRMLEADQVRRLARGEPVTNLEPVTRRLDEERWRSEWDLRNGWNRTGDPPPLLPGGEASIRHVEIHDTYDVKQWFWKANDGIRETIWPSVYNRSRISDRQKYITQPDWNTYSISGKSVSFHMPDETYNHVEIAGAAYGSLNRLYYDSESQEQDLQQLFERPAQQERTYHRLPEQRRGGILRFDNEVQETSMGKFMVYNIEPGRKPAGRSELTYYIDTQAAADNITVDDLNSHIAGRYMPDERSTVVALPRGAPRRENQPERAEMLPLVHVLIPFEFRHEEYDSQGFSGRSSTVSRSTYTWENMHGGLDGIELNLPVLDLESEYGDLVPLNIRVMDPLWPDRTLMDVTFSVERGTSQTVWLDTRDRILPNGYPLYLQIASASGDFSADILDGAEIELVFRDYEEAAVEHTADRFIQVKDNAAHFSQPGANSKKLRVYQRFSLDMEDLFRVDPNHWPGRQYWYWNNRFQGSPPYQHSEPPEDVPVWAHRQVELLKQVKHFTNWWMDNRLIENGEYGGGLSDDGDLTPQFVAAAMMGVTPDRVAESIRRIMNAYYDQGLFTDGLATIMADELHAYEEGIQVLKQDLQFRYGNPTAVERLMETASAYDRITAFNDIGHRQFISNFYSGSEIADETVWNWQYPHHFLILTPGVSLVEYNGNPQVKELILEMADGLVAQRTSDGDDGWKHNTIIHFPSGEPDPDSDPGLRHAAHILWAAHRWTGDDKYLEPLMDLGPSSMGTISSNLLDQLDLRDTWNDDILENTTPHSGSGLFRHLAWQLTENPQYLEELYEDQIAANASLMYVYTEGHLWTDRVSVPSQDLQRARLGGVGSWRSAILPGHLVSWEFEKPALAEDVAIRFSEAGREQARMEVFNLKKEAVSATMSAWDLAPGVWEITEEIESGNGLERVNERRVELQTMESVDLTFAPFTTTRVTMQLVEEDTPLSERPDIGIGTDDVAFDNSTLTVTVHNLGSEPSPATELIFNDQNGREIARGEVPSLEPPLDLQPKTTLVRLRVPSGTEGELILNPDNTFKEITRRNNAIQISN